MLVTGVNGQDGVHLARLLLTQGRPVVGTTQPGSLPSPYLAGVSVGTLDVRDTEGFAALVAAAQPSAVVNLAAYSSVGGSWQHPELVAAVNGAAVEGMLAVLRSQAPEVRFLQASSAEIYGPPRSLPVTEDAPHAPASPYGEAKLRAHQGVASARDAGLWAANAILFNHESALRPPAFVTRKITRAAAAISLGLADSVSLGTLDIRRDWGWAGDHVRALSLMLEADQPADYVVATGASRPLSDLVEVAFAAAGIADPWPHVVQDPGIARPHDTPDLYGDPSLIGRSLGWTPSVSFEELVGRMVEVDLRRLQTGVEDDPAYL